MNENKIYDYSFDAHELAEAWRQENPNSNMSRDEVIRECINLLLKYTVFTDINTLLKDYDKIQVNITQKGYDKYGELTNLPLLTETYDLVEMRKIVDIEHVNLLNFLI